MNRRGVLSLLLTSAAGCAGGQTLVPQMGQPAAPQVVDGAPLSVLPRGALILTRVNGPALFSSSFGGQASQIMTSALPLGPESGFSPARDVQRIYGAAYAMEGMDFVSVVQGTFNVAAMEQAARARAANPSSAPVVVSRYGGYELFTVSNMGFVVLSPTTILTGTETALRRTIDRLRYVPALDGVPPWMAEVFDDQRAEFAYAADLRDQGVVGAAEERMPFLFGLQLVRGFGNFQAPGMNLAGSLTYRDDVAAAAGATSLQDLKRLAYFITLLTNFGLGGGSAPEIRTQALGTNVAFASNVDSQLTSTVLSMVGKLLTPGSGGLW